MNKAIKKYLQNYAESEINFLGDFPSNLLFANSIVIPTYNESDLFFHRFIESDLSQQNALLIVVINQPDSDINQQQQLILHHNLLNAGQTIWRKENLSLVQVADHKTHLLVIDRYSKNNSIAENEGVGLARKIGADIATYLINEGLIR